MYSRTSAKNPREKRCPPVCDILCIQCLLHFLCGLLVAHNALDELAELHVVMTTGRTLGVGDVTLHVNREDKLLEMLRAGLQFLLLCSYV